MALCSGNAKPVSVRGLAVDVLYRVLVRKHSLDQSLRDMAPACPDPRDRALLAELCYGVTRWAIRLRATLARLLHRPLRSRDADIELVALLGLYQLIHTHIPAYAAVAETVALVEQRGKPWARGLVNSALRRFPRERESIDLAIEQDPPSRYAHPEWLIDEMKGAWPEQWERMLDANNQRAPMTLRVNSRHANRADYLVRLRAAGLAGGETPHSLDGILLERACDVAELPGFSRGDVSVQDEASQLAQPLMNLRNGQRVLDACAAPGGKLAHILESGLASLEVTAVDADPQRLRRAGDNLARLGLEAKLICAELQSVDGWWDGRPFDRILLDAPCSATGVIRRHPDIKHRRRASDLEELTRVQLECLRTARRLLAPGGQLLYATCSVLPRENRQQVLRFIREHADINEVPIDSSWGLDGGPGRQILPGQEAMDGFYYAVLQKH